jgi:hypothetical protein
MNMFGMKRIMESDMLSPDEWEIHEWDGLDDLGFESNGMFKMVFDHEDVVNGDERKLELTVYKKKDGWYLEQKIDGKVGDTLRFKQNGSLLTKIHDIFEKF